MNIWKRIRGNNRGSSTIIVILCIAFISILSTLLLTLTVNNIQMKAISRKAKTNFYVAEIAFDEIKAGLEEVTAKELEKAYNEVMENYIHKSKEEKEKLFSKTYIDGLAKTLGGDVDATTYYTSLIAGYIKQPSATLDMEIHANQLVKDTAEADNPRYLTLKQVRINYTDTENYKTTIESDITIHTPSIEFNAALGSSSVYVDYSLIADNKITLDTAPNVTIGGNAYAGDGGIVVNNASTLVMENASNIVTRGDISVAERSSLKISNNPGVWAKSIKTAKGTNTEEATTISIDGKCYVADDLMLNAKNSEVNISGEYYGYSYLANTLIPPADPLTPQSSSAVVINGINSVLDLSDVDRLLIAGKAYIDPASRGNESTRIQGNVQTGESLAVKGNQYAYLVPEEYMWCGSNPVTLSEYNSREATIIEVDYNKVLSNPLPIQLSDYADGFSNIFYQAAGQDFVYYYIKFKSQEKANEYLQKYVEVYNSNVGIGMIDNYIKSYAKSIKVKEPFTSMISSGNVFTFNGNTGKSTLLKNSVNPDGDSLRLIAENLVKRYDSMRYELTQVPTGGYYNENSMFKTIVHTSNINMDHIDTNYVNGVKTVTVDSENVVYIVDNAGSGPYIIQEDGNLPNMGRQGIVIATGSVVVNCDYTGLILAGEDIILRPGVCVTASSDIVKTVLGANHPQVNRYFVKYETTPFPVSEGVGDGSRVIVSDLIVYDNWKLNED